MLADSNLQDMQRYALHLGFVNHPLGVYGDPTYPVRSVTPQMVNFSKAMSFVEVSVEWLTGDIVEFVLFKFGLRTSTNKFFLIYANYICKLVCLTS